MAARAEEAALRSAAESRAEVALSPPKGLGGGAAEMVLSNAGLGGGAAAGARSSRTLWSLGTGDQRAVCDLLRT